MNQGYFDAVLSDNGAPILATVSVFLANTQTLATIYADPDGAAQKDNPFQTDSLGRFKFFASPGRYDIQISGTGITTYTLEDVFINLPHRFLDIVIDEGSAVTENGEVVYDPSY